MNWALLTVGCAASSVTLIRSVSVPASICLVTTGTCVPLITCKPTMFLRSIRPIGVIRTRESAFGIHGTVKISWTSKSHGR